MRAFIIVVLSCLLPGIALAVVSPNTNGSRRGSQVTGSSLERKQIEQHQRLERVGSSNSSFSEFRESRRRNCGPGPVNNYPRRNQPCYRPSVGQSRPFPGSCTSYLQCSPDTCRWAEFYCDAPLFWDQSQGICVQRQEADCSHAIFGKNYKMHAVHVSTGKVITDLMNGNDWDSTTDIIVKDPIKPDSWNQVFVTNQLQYHGEHFTFAFKNNLDSNYKVMAAVDGKPKSEIETSEIQQAQQWRVLPTDQDGYFQIVNVQTGEALAVTNHSDGQGNFLVELREQDQSDEAQLFRFEDVERLCRYIVCYYALTHKLNFSQPFH